MKNLGMLPVLLVILSALTLPASAQIQTFILFRHAEKDVSATADKKNPNLSDAGRQRSERLLQIAQQCKPQEIFSTIYNRTRQTVMPLAIKSYEGFRLKIEIYDSSAQEEFARKLLDSTSQCTVVVGHSNTIPALANILLKDNKYKDLADTEYNKIWIIKVKKRGKKPYKIRETKIIEY